MLIYPRKILFLILLFLAGHVMHAQKNIGQPFIHNFTKEVSNSGLRNWKISQDSIGILYFANDEGLLSFDGANWKIYQVENRTILRSIFIDEERIYAGCQGDIGYFEADSTGTLCYHSLKHKIPFKDNQFADVWKINKYHEFIIFRTTDKILAYNGDKISIHWIQPDFSFYLNENRKIYLNQLELQFDDNSSGVIQKIYSEPKFRNKSIQGLLNQDNHVLVFTNEGSIYKYQNSTFAEWKTPNQQFLKENRIQCVERIDKRNIAIGTLSGGVLIIDDEGNTVNQINSLNGLLNNEIIDLYLDNSGNLWISQSNGISCIETNSPYRTIKPDNKNISPGYAVKIHQDKLFLGTSVGLYASKLNKTRTSEGTSNFNIIQGTKGQVWALNEFNGELLLSHHEGAFRVEEGKAIKISKTQGSWGFIPIDDSRKILLEGHYKGLNIYEFSNGHWTFKNEVQNMIDESCRILAKDSNENIWVAHPYRGVYRIVLDERLKSVKEIKLYNSKNGFPSNWVHVFEVKGDVVFTTEKGVYSYNEENDNFQPSSIWASIIDSSKRVQRLVEDDQGNIWSVIDDDIGLITINDIGFEKVVNQNELPKLSGKLVGGFEHIYPHDRENVFFPTETGFIHYNPQKSNSVKGDLHSHIHEVKLGDSTSIYGGYKSERWMESKFKYYENAFTFKFSATEYSDFDQIEFQYILEGLDEKWSPWVKKNFKEYTALPHGDYQFKMRARNALGKTSDTDSYSFSISPPWYASLLAKLLYCILGLILLLSAFLVPFKKFEKEKSNIIQEKEEVLQETTEEYQKIVAENQEQISKLQEDKLKAEIQFKNKELASTTMHLVQKGGLLNKLKDNLTALQNKTTQPEVKKEIRSTLRMLNQNLQIDEDWEQFANYFDQVHVDFLKRLKEEYPQLTPKDQKLCTYLKMNLSTKEIVPLMNISVRGVEVSRYRLRKKLGLDSSVNLNDFMMNF